VGAWPQLGCASRWFCIVGCVQVRHFLADRMVAFRTTVNANRTQLTLFMIFARVFPFTPNWFINVASPQLHIPVWQFAVGVGVGLIPYNFLSCKVRPRLPVVICMCACSRVRVGGVVSCLGAIFAGGPAACVLEVQVRHH